MFEGLTYFVRTFGCQMNNHDSERVAGILEANGAQPSLSIELADIPIFMTCSVREKADTHLYALAQSLKSAPLPKSGKRTLCIGGCIAQRDGAMLKKNVPVVDVIFGTQALAELPKLITDVRRKEAFAVNIEEPNYSFSSDLPSVRASKYQAWLPIMNGCNNFCTYCIVPFVRGRERSRPYKDVINEVQSLIDEGVQEITLLGQNVNSYKGDRGENFAYLLEGVAKTNISRIRFTSSHPKDLSDEIINVMASNSNIMPHLHLAVQSGSDAVLKRMNRHYTQKSYLALIKRLRKAIPHIALTTDIIVGFPQETEQDFLDTLNLVKEAQFSSAYTFIYSKRPGTKAETMPLGYSEEEVRDRFNRLVKLVSLQSITFNQRFKNTFTHVLVEGLSKKDPNFLTGHNPENICVHFKGDKSQIGSVQKVKILDAKTWYLTGTTE